MHSIVTVKNAIIDAGERAFGASRQQILIDSIAFGEYEYADENYSKSVGFFYINGIIEKATTSFFERDFITGNIFPPKKLNFIYQKKLIENVISNIEGIFKYYSELGIVPPVILSVAIINGRGFTITANQFLDTAGEIDRDILIVPDVVIREVPENFEKTLKPVFDSIWNSCGYVDCRYYDENGEFNINR